MYHFGLKIKEVKRHMKIMLIFFSKKKKSHSGQLDHFGSQNAMFSELLIC